MTVSVMFRPMIASSEESTSQRNLQLCGLTDSRNTRSAHGEALFRDLGFRAKNKAGFRAENKAGWRRTFHRTRQRQGGDEQA
jgi:hypothetical protein